MRQVTTGNDGKAITVEGKSSTSMREQSQDFVLLFDNLCIDLRTIKLDTNVSVDGEMVLHGILLDGQSSDMVIWAKIAERTDERAE